MKTLKIFAILSLALIFNGVNTVYSKTNNLSDNGNGDPPQYIKYQVTVHPFTHLDSPLPLIYVVMTDENGTVVAHPQIFQKGTWIYGFIESVHGPVTGFRVARIVIPGGDTPFWLYPNPDKQKGTFEPGNLYQFNLYPLDPTQPISIVE